MDVYDEYYLLFFVSLFLLAISLIHSLRIYKHVPDDVMLVVMTALILVCAYNEEIGAYSPSARIENAGFLMLALLVTSCALWFVKDTCLSLVGVCALVVLLAAGALGGSNYGIDWLYDSTGMKITLNTFLIVLICGISIGGLIWWKLSKSPWFQWILSVLLITFSNALAFSAIVGRSKAWYRDTGDTYAVLDMNSLGLYCLMGLSWYVIPSYTTFKKETSIESNAEKEPLISNV